MNFDEWWEQNKHIVTATGFVKTLIKGFAKLAFIAGMEFSESRDR